jgi:phosphate transport system protein
MELHPHTRQVVDTELNQLEHDLLEMGSIAEKMVAQAVDSLCALDVKGALRVLELDDEVDQRDIEIENRCLRFIALQHPMASDLRAVGTAMKMITDIERVGDLAVDIARATLKIEKELGDANIVDVPRMANVARSMFRQALEAFVKRDVELVKAVIKQDDEVDDLYRQLRGQIHESMRSQPDLVVSDSWLLLAIHHIERIADHAVNIAERVHFLVTGEFKQLAASHRSDNTEA